MRSLSDWERMNWVRYRHPAPVLRAIALPLWPSVWERSGFGQIEALLEDQGWWGDSENSSACWLLRTRAVSTGAPVQAQVLCRELANPAGELLGKALMVSS